jgi:hypothetical protein
VNVYVRAGGELYSRYFALVYECSKKLLDGFAQLVACGRSVVSERLSDRGVRSVGAHVWFD